MQNVFTDRRAYVNALTYELETETSASGKKSKQQDIDEYKKEKATVEFPDGHKQQFNFHELEETYNSLKDQRTKLSAELGDVLKPVTEASNKMSSFVSDHMVDLTPTQIDGLKKKTEEWDAKIVQINVADANIVDRCESCHMNAREPLRISAAVMTGQGREDIRMSTRAPSPAIPTRNCWGRMIPTNLAARLATRATGGRPPASKKRTATTSTGCGHCFPNRTPKPAARLATPPICI